MKKGNFEIGFRQAATFPGGFIREELTTKSPRNWSSLSYLQGGNWWKSMTKRSTRPNSMNQWKSPSRSSMRRTSRWSSLFFLEEAAPGHFISCHYPPDTQGRGLARVKPLTLWHPFGLMVQSPLNISADLIISYGGIRWLPFSASEPVMWAGPRWR